MTLVESILLAVYFLILAVLSMYGSHRYFMAFLYYRHKYKIPMPQGALERLPVVTIQLPVFNEMYVVERLIDAVCKIDYPRELLEIQVLDDSTDETSAIAEACVERHRAQGLDVVYLHRTNRHGFKAGALEEGLKKAKGELVAVFDADFVASPEFLQKTVPYFANPKVGMVQVRWGHINRDFSALTQAQSIFLDGHFMIEHTARNRSGRFFNFNGTAGVWRRTTIKDAGGWQHDTLTEDLDLSYRAQLKGWQFVFLPHVVSPAEVPVDMNAFKGQQHRWAKGSIQTARKLLPAILKADLPFKVKQEAFFHLTNNIAYLLMVVLSLLMPLSMIIRFRHGWYGVLLLDFPFFVMATLSVSAFFVASQREVGQSLW
ncbi:MAG: glycosyltransferase, partial [Deltaproteobacteria bacterium]|nr:glycosyltransferase [Deltaproteobacteria bacterium]